jgi:hypothetical protein
MHSHLGLCNFTYSGVQKMGGTKHTPPIVKELELYCGSILAARGLKGGKENDDDEEKIRFSGLVLPN